MKWTKTKSNNRGDIQIEMNGKNLICNIISSLMRVTVVHKYDSS